MRRAAADFVEQHEALRRRVVQDVRRFAHLHHEGRSAAAEVVGGTDAREDTIDRADTRRTRRHEAAGVGEQHDERGLAHVRRFAAHVRAGDDQHAPRRVETQVVRDERRAVNVFDHQVSAGVDVEPGFVAEVRRDELESSGAFGHRREHVEFGERRRAGAQPGRLQIDCVEQFVEQRAFACERPRLTR